MTRQPSRAQHVTALDIGPHDLVIQLGDCEFFGACSCGKPLGVQRPDQSFNDFGMAWERHVMTQHRDCDCEPCSW
ncbi:MAG TPA: hypothetical protein VHZ96_26310 [Frankiaceae bacterium]|nr:hypothetical protein [Frankiaceae bacterium]